jgi:hypothetical protein
LIAALQELYVLHIDLSGTKYVGLDIHFDRSVQTVSISMADYVRKALIRFNATDIKATDSPGVYIPPPYGTPQQYTVQDISLPISVNRIRAIVGVFQWYARVVDPTLFPALSMIASRQHAATEDAEKMAWRLLGYVKKYPNATIVYHASDMQVCAHSDASY